MREAARSRTASMVFMGKIRSAPKNSRAAARNYFGSAQIRFSATYPFFINSVLDRSHSSDDLNSLRGMKRILS